MTFKYNLKKDDYYRVRSYEFSHMKSFRLLVLIERIAGILVLALAANTLRQYISNIGAIAVFVAACLVWIVGFPWIMNFRFRAHAKKEIRESGERVRDGEVTLTFGQNVIEQTSPGQVTRRTTYKRVLWVEDTGKYVLIYDDTNPTPLIIPSDQIFESKAERQQFVKNLRDDCDVQVENKKKVLGKGPRLKVRK
ncbi:MAG: hypothetical protein IJG57_02575 [Firmicutes bacterium]|jgi:hypothetical protein|nr:hypothetical protein [Bacillota bacterium]